MRPEMMDELGTGYKRNTEKHRNEKINDKSNWN